MIKLPQEEVKAVNMIAEKSFNLHFDFLKKVLTVSTTVFAIMVSLAPLALQEQRHSVCVLVLYCLAVSTLALGILGVGVCLYSFVLQMRILADQSSRTLTRKHFGK